MVKGYRDLMLRGKARDWLYITKVLQDALGRATELGRMLSGHTREPKGRLAETCHLTPGT